VTFLKVVLKGHRADIISITFIQHTLVGKGRPLTRMRRSRQAALPHPDITRWTQQG